MKYKISFLKYADLVNVYAEDFESLLALVNVFEKANKCFSVYENNQFCKPADLGLTGFKFWV